eukprot:1452437-Rhodomonas_salina.1
MVLPADDYYCHFKLLPLGPRGRGIRLRACYVMSGADIPYGAVDLRDFGTDLAYGATQRPVLSERMVLRNV